jgi:hypothetical protein
MRPFLLFGYVATFLAWALAFSAQAADEFEQPPIEYSRSTADNRVSKLQARLDSGDLRLAYDKERGFLPDLLKALDVPIESQTLVFSKTSLQRHRISPKKPRAIYFSDDVYVGFCQRGDVLEMTAVDPQLGAVFYTLDQKQADAPRLVRQTDNCLICHSSSRSDSVPGHVLRSLFVGKSGQPILSAGSVSVDHSTPFEQRWGGWYVTGKHGSQKHMGNLVVHDSKAPRDAVNEKGQNVTELGDRLDVRKYLSPHSDIAALMVLEHQTLVHNRLTKANFETRRALYSEADMNRSFGEPEGKRWESTTRRIQSAGDSLVDALLLVDEAELSEPISGTSGFAEKFSEAGPRDARGRSLRELDRNRRLFKHPCSYLIYSQAFDGLPQEMRDYVWKRLWNVLSEGQDPERFAHLSSEDRLAIVEILRNTKPGLPEYWK